jgi:hypothetical protein
MDAEGSVFRLQQPDSGPYLKPNEYSPHPHALLPTIILSEWISYLNMLTNILTAGSSRFHFGFFIHVLMMFTVLLPKWQVRSCNVYLQ